MTNIQKIYETVLEDMLPSPWSRRVAAITAPLSISSLFFPNFLKTIGMELTPEASLYIRLVLPLLILLTGTLTVLVLVVRRLKKYKAKTNNAEGDIQQYWKYHKEITLGVGSYHDVLTKHGQQFIRITLKDISKKYMPPPYESDSIPDEIETDVATIGFSHGFMLTPGSRIKKIETSPFFDEYCFDMSKIENNEEDRYSIFLFRTEQISDGDFFFRCYVDHINPAKKEADLNIFFIWQKQAQQIAQPDS